MSLDINKIASDKITAMVASGDIEKLIADGVEKNVKQALESACNDYGWRREIEVSIEKTIGTVASTLNFSAYANFLSDRMRQQIDSHFKNEIVSSMKDTFEKIYFKVPENIKLSDILNLYQKHIEKELDSDDKREWGRIDFSLERESKSFLRIKAGKPDRSSYDHYDKGFELSVINGRDKSYLCWVRFNGNDFKTSMDLDKLCDFEILIFNLMFTQTKIEIDIDEDFCFDVDFEDEEY